MVNLSWVTVPLAVTSYQMGSPGFAWHFTDPNGSDFLISPPWVLGVDQNNPDPGQGSLFIPGHIQYGPYHIKIWIAVKNSGGSSTGVNIVEGDFLVADKTVIGPSDPGCSF